LRGVCSRLAIGRLIFMSRGMPFMRRRLHQGRLSATEIPKNIFRRDKRAPAEEVSHYYRIIAVQVHSLLAHYCDPGSFDLGSPLHLDGCHRILVARDAWKQLESSPRKALRLNARCLWQELHAQDPR
jgi:hypothetical protein